MSQALQSKLQLLAILAVAFILLSVPLFYQVRADAADSPKEAKNTFFSKMFRDVLKDVAKKPNEDLQVEDYQKWQSDHPDCGAECDANADPDGDGVSNKDEVTQGRNPACNEEQKGKDYCAGQSDVPPPVQNRTAALDDLIYEKTGATPGFSEDFQVPKVTPDYDRWIVTYSVTGYQGVSGYTVQISDKNNTAVCCTPQSPGFLVDAHEGQDKLEGDKRPPSGHGYTVSIQTQAIQGQWHVLIRGVRDAR